MIAGTVRSHSHGATDPEGDMESVGVDVVDKSEDNKDGDGIKKEEGKMEGKEEEDVLVEEARKRPRQRVRTDRQCLNRDCPGADRAALSTASAFHREYYGDVLNKEEEEAEVKKKRKICADCADRSGATLRGVADKIREGQPALRGLDAFMAAMDMVTLDDSDEDVSAATDSSEESEFEVDLTEMTGERGVSAKDMLERLVQGTLKDKFKLEEQVTSAAEDLGQRLDQGEEKIKEVDQMFKDVEKDIDNLRNELYKDFRPKITQVEYLDTFPPTFLLRHVHFYMFADLPCGPQRPGEDAQPVRHPQAAASTVSKGAKASHTPASSSTLWSGQKLRYASHRRKFMQYCCGHLKGTITMFFAPFPEHARAIASAWRSAACSPSGGRPGLRYAGQHPEHLEARGRRRRLPERGRTHLQTQVRRGGRQGQAAEAPVKSAHA